MTALVMRGVRGNDLPTAPLRDNRFPYSYEMVFEQGKYRAYADTFADLVEVLIPGYGDADDDDARLVQRIGYMKQLQPVLQAMVMNMAPSEDAEELTEADQEVLRTPVSQPVTIAEWGNRMPLVLTTCDYAPYTDFPAPVSSIADVEDPPNIWWLRIEDDESLLLSLARFGWIVLSQHGGTVA